MAQLKGIAINNFRVFKAHTQFQFAPITILTGPNSSGKSSLFKALMLLADSAKKYNLRELDFTGESHYLGNLEDVLNHENGSDTLTFDLDFTGEKDLLFGLLEKGFSLKLEYVEQKLTKVELSTSCNIVNNINYLDKKKILLSRFLIKNQNSILEEYRYINMVEIMKNQKNALFLPKREHTSPELYSIIDENLIFKKLKKCNKNQVKDFIDIVKKYTYMDFFPNITLPSFIDVKFVYDYIELMYDDIGFDDEGWYIESCKTLLQTFPESLKELYQPLLDIVGHLTMDEITSQSFSDWLNDVFRQELDLLNHYLENLLFNDVLSKIIYTEAFRANTKRIYAYQSQGTSINTLLVDFNRLLSQKNKEEGEVVSNFLNNSIKIFEIGEGLKIVNIEGAANKISVVRKNSEINLADLGYGYTQFLSIPIKMVASVTMKDDVKVIPFKNQYLNPVDGYFYTQGDTPTKRQEKYHFPEVNGPLFLLEEPETNLHPKLQSLLADFFVEACRTFAMTLVAETHSEYLVRKLQYLVAKGEIRPQDVALYYFYPPGQVPDGHEQVERINILPDGRLDKDFGTGFFDESAKLMMSLLTGEALN